jgi:hypothetical protein
MALREIVCVDCGKRFVLLPKKPGLVNTCPQCSVPPVEPFVPERKLPKRRQKTTNEVVADHERRMRRHKKLMELISPKGKH